MRNHTTQTGVCEICRSKTPPSPPVSPNSIVNVIYGCGSHNQVSLDHWCYFYDDQEEELNSDRQPIPVSPLLLTAVCSCGCNLWEATLANEWKRATDHKPENA